MADDKMRAPKDYPKTEQAAIGTGGVSDAPTAQDALGFEPYVKALASFLSNPLTLPPLTLSLEGEWGTGKSSFMRLLQKELQQEYEKTGQKFFPVEFNAWRHDKEDALWAAFAINFLE